MVEHHIYQLMVEHIDLIAMCMSFRQMLPPGNPRPSQQDLTQVDRNLITIRELNYLLSDRMFARRCAKNQGHTTALLGDAFFWCGERVVLDFYVT